MDTSTLLTTAAGLLVAGAGAALGAPLARYANQLVADSPTGIDHDAERQVLAFALSERDAYHKVSVLTPDDFHLDAHRRIFDALTSTETRAEDETGPDGQPLKLVDLAQTRERLGPDAQETFDTLVALEVTEASVMAKDGAGAQVLRGSQTLAMPMAVELSDHSPKPRYLPRDVSRLRAVSVSLYAAAVALSALLLPGKLLVEDAGIAAQVAFSVAIVIAGVASILITLVDLDVLEIPTRPLVAGTAVAWAGGLAGAALAGGYARTAFAPWWSGVLQAAIVVVGVFVLFELLNLAFKKLRGKDGQGFGDTLLIPLVFGVPVLLTGNGILAYFTLLGAAGAVLVVWVVRRAATGAGKDVPLPFGPELCAAWLAASWAYALGWVSAL